jgi:dihydropteroate synthase
MSHPWRSEPGIALLAPVTTVEQAASAAAAGAGLVDAGDDAALVPAIRRAVSGVRVCGEHEDADLMRDAHLAARTGAALICPGADAAEAAARRGVAAGRILVQAAPAGIEAVVRAGWPVLADLEELADLEGLEGLEGGTELDGLTGLDGPRRLARTEAAAAVCAWLGASVLRTRHVGEVRRCADMTESILGRRPPTWAVRGLA